MKKHSFKHKIPAWFFVFLLVFSLSMGALAEPGTIFPWLACTMDVALVTADPELVEYRDAPSGGIMAMVKLVSLSGVMKTDDIKANCHQIIFRDGHGDEFEASSLRFRGISFDKTAGFIDNPEQDAFELLFFLKGKDESAITGAKLVVSGEAQGERIVVPLDKASRETAANDPGKQDASGDPSFLLGGVRYTISALEDEPRYQRPNRMDGKEGHMVAFSYPGHGSDARDANKQLYSGARLRQPDGDMVKPYSNSDNIGNPYELYFGLSDDVLLSDCVFTIAGDDGEVEIPLSGIGGDDAEHEAEQDEIPESGQSGEPQASASGEQPLVRLLARVPAETFQWDYLSFINYQGAQSLSELEAGFYPMTLLYFAEKGFTSTMGFPPTDVHQSMSVGTPPFDHAWMQGTFSPEQLKTMLSQQGYLQILPAQDGLSLWGLEGNFSAGLQFNKDKRDFSFLFGGEIGQRWPVAFDESIIVSSRNEQALRTIAEGKGPMLSEDPRMQALLKALASKPVKQLIIEKTERVVPLSPEPIYLIAIAEVEEQEHTTVLLGMEYADLASAQAAAKRLKRSLPNAMLKAKFLPLSELLKSHNGRQMALRTEEGHDGKAWLVIPFQFSKPKDIDPSQYKSPFRLFVSIMNNRDMGWLQE